MRPSLKEGPGGPFLARDYGLALAMGSIRLPERYFSKSSSENLKPLPTW